MVQLEVLADRHDTIELLLEAPSTNDALRAVMKQVGGLGLYGGASCNFPV
jgi:hypothetical protein